MKDAKELAREILDDSYECSRVWEAWTFNTMTDSDFHLSREDMNRVNDTADLILRDRREVIEKIYDLGTKVRGPSFRGSSGYVTGISISIKALDSLKAEIGGGE